MKTKITHLVFLLALPILMLLGNQTFAQLAVTATGTNGTCASDASISATATGNTGTVNYQLLQGGSIIRNYQPSNSFNNLPAGTYVVKVQDATTTLTAQSSAVNLTTTYQAMLITVVNGSVGCSTAKGQVTINVTKGKAPFIYSISPDPNSVGSQSSNIFTNLPIGAYTISVTDACGATQTAGASLGLGTSTTLATISPRYQSGNGSSAPIVYGVGTNKCAQGNYINIGGGWGYVGNSAANLSSFDQAHFSWRYEYPSGSGNIYGIGGVIGAAAIPMTSGYVLMPATAAYPFTNGDLIIYDECGNSRKLTGDVRPTLNQNARGLLALYDCVKGGGVRTYVDNLALVCLPVTWSFTNTATAVVTTTTQPAQTYDYFYGLVPGQTYSVVGVDALGHTFSSATLLIPSTLNPIGSGGFYPDYSLLNA